MENKRHKAQIDCDSHCILIGLDGITYKALLGDLTVTGASIKMNDTMQHGLHIGEMCGLVLSDNPNRSSSKHKGIIIELESGNVGISFHHQEHRHKKHTYSPPPS